MTAASIAGTAGSPGRQQQIQTGPAEQPVARREFSRTLQERTALTDTTGAGGSISGKLAGAAPSAVPFDRAPLFGCAVDSEHEADVPTGGRGKPLAAAQAGGAEPRQADLPEAGASDTRTKLASTPGVGAGQPLTVRGEFALATDPQRPQFQPTAMPSQATDRSLSPAAAKAPSNRAAAPGLPVAPTFAPVNVVVRTTSAGLHVVARIGGPEGEDPARLESTIADVVRDAGGALGELRVNGREVRRRR